jgi:hypothetical protein
MPIVGLDYVQVAAPPGCEPEARRFYGGLVGLVRVEKPAALRARGGAWFVLTAGQQLYVGVEDPFALARKAHPALRVAGGELEALAERLIARAAPCDGTTRGPGSRGSTSRTRGATGSS